MSSTITTPTTPGFTSPNVNNNGMTPNHQQKSASKFAAGHTPYHTMPSSYHSTTTTSPSVAAASSVAVNGGGGSMVGGGVDSPSPNMNRFLYGSGSGSSSGNRQSENPLFSASSYPKSPAKSTTTTNDSYLTGGLHKRHTNGGTTQDNNDSRNSSNPPPPPRASMLSNVSRYPMLDEHDNDNHPAQQPNSNDKGGVSIRSNVLALTNGIQNDDEHNNGNPFATWVVVFGYTNPQNKATVLRRFESYGTVVRKSCGSTNPTHNWMGLQYATRLQAEKALCQNASLISDSLDHRSGSGGGGILVGVSRLDRGMARMLGVNVSSAADADRTKDDYQRFPQQQQQDRYENVGGKRKSKANDGMTEEERSVLLLEDEDILRQPIKKRKGVVEHVLSWIFLW